MPASVVSKWARAKKILGAVGRGISFVAKPVAKPIAAVAQAATSPKVATAAFTASFLPVAALGYGGLKIGGAAASVGWSAAKAYKKQLVKQLSKGRGWKIGLALVGAGMGASAYTGMRMAAGAKRSQQRRDPANAMGLSTNLHYVHRR